MMWSWGNGGYGWGWGMWFMPIIMIVVWGLIIWGIVALARDPDAAAGVGAAVLLQNYLRIGAGYSQERYARGEIGKEEFEERKRNLL